MQPDDIFRAFALDPAVGREHLAHLPVDAPADWRYLAVALAAHTASRELRVLGIGGGQGAGKSTLSGLLAQALGTFGLRAVVLSLDDFYHTHAQRQQLGARHHPLLATRGVPGSHDTDLLVATLSAVFTAGRHGLPVFDKGRDDRAADLVWVDGPVDVVVLEGWCVGARAQPAALLDTPINALETIEDVDGTWRRFVNQQLGLSYEPVWDRLDALLFLAVPDLAAVRRWRGEQETARAPGERMTPEQLVRFVAHYERLTRWMLETLPQTADYVGFLDSQHRLERLQIKP